MEFEKSIVQEVSGWLRVYSDGSVDRTWSGPPEVKFITDPVPPHPHQFIHGVATRDVQIHKNNKLKVRIYMPDHIDIEQDNNKLPIILHFHGGGFCISQPDWYMYYTVYTKLVRSIRAICVSVYLPLAPENRLPAASDHGYSALLWLQSLAKGADHEPWLSNHGDFNRVFLLGDSSGGNLVHDVAVRAGKVDLSPLRLAGGIPIHPGFVRSSRSKSEVEQPESPFLTLDMVDKFLELGLPIGSNKDHPITCPMGVLAPLMEKLNLPAFLLCVAGEDLIKDTEMEYYEAMKNGGRDIELYVNEGVGHSFYLNKLAVEFDPNTGAQTNDLIERIGEFVKKH